MARHISRARTGAPMALACVLLASAPLAHGQTPRGQRLADRWQVSGGGLTVGLDPVTAEITSMTASGETLRVGSGGMHFLDGRAERPLPPVDVTRGRVQPDGVLLPWSDRATGLTGSYAIAADDQAIYWQVEVTNSGAEQRWLEVRLGLPVALDGSWRYWDGRNPAVEVGPNSRILSAKATPVLEDEACTKLPSHYGLNFPLNCLWSDAIGLAVGLDPHEPRSYFAGGAEPGLSAADTVYYATHLVIDPGGTETARFVLFAFDPDWAERGALEHMYATFPDVYSPDPATDPRLAKHCAVTGTQALLLGQPFVWEDARRLGLGWSWGTNARYAGMCYPSEGWVQNQRQIQQAYWAFLNPRYVRPSWVKDAVAIGAGLSVAEHQRMAREAFDGAADALAVAFDITCQYLDKEVALAHFADSQLMRPNGTFVDIPNVQVMYAWGNSFGEAHARLVREGIIGLQPGGVHFDNAVGYDQHYGPGAQTTPGRAFSPEHGQVYSLEGVAQAMHMRAAREHLVRGRRVYVAGNTVGTWFGAALADVSLIESLGPWHGEGERWRGAYAQPGFEHYLALRYLMGGKQLNFCGLYPWEVKLTEEDQALSYEQRQEVFLRRYEEITRDLPLFAYRVGATTISYILRSCANIRAHADTLSRLARAGWRAVPAARADDPALWVERFGDLPGGLLTIGNPTDAQIHAEISFDPERCGTVALASADGAPVEASVQNGATHAPVALPPRTPLAWQVVATMNPPLPDGSALVASVAATATRVVIHCPAGCATTLRVALPEQCDLAAMTVGGERLQAGTEGGIVTASLALETGEATIELRHREWYRIAPQVKDFPFFTEAGCRSAIVLRPHATAEERAAAEHLSRYFQYWLAHQADPAKPYDLLWHAAADAHQIPVVTPDAVPPDAAVVLIGAPKPATVAGLDAPALGEDLRGEARVTRAAEDAPALVLRARSGADLDGALRALLAKLDERYPF